MRAASPGLATTSRLRRRVTFDGFFSRRWFIFALRRMTLPLLVILNRLAAPRCVFIFGMGADSSLLRGRFVERRFCDDFGADLGVQVGVELRVQLRIQLGGNRRRRLPVLLRPAS